ncbi:hypothetical protein C7N43_36665 [Sphingobacteriales bacterium UPWRP_1]|nr:hypothetical protein BVG80_05830 [Sphingobacteriales bacterium TSM_CSM]PSJ71962.1 hypothetical protein C7N43_36665 [Sphingobacteriales bacterium UPWRP_1]
MTAGMIKAGYYSLLLGILGLLAAGTAVLWYYDYDSFTLLLAQRSGKMAVLPLVRSRFFTPSKFEFARIAGVVLLAGYLFALPMLVKKASRATNAVINSGQQTGLLIKAWARLVWPGTRGGRFCFVLLMLLLLIKAVYYLQYPVQYDEAWTYNYFLSGNIFVALAVYNNHPLYVVLAWFFGFLPFDAAVNMRIPVVIFGVLSVLAMIGLLRHFYNYHVSLAASAYFAFSGPVTFYMLYARGYMLLTFFVIASVYCMFKMLETGKAGEQGEIWNKWTYLFAVACALGFYSMPTFIYPYAAIFFYTTAVALRRQMRVPWLGATLVVVVLTLLLYAPMLLGTGVRPGAEVATNAHSWQWVWQHGQHYLNRCWYFLFGTALHYPVLATLSAALLWAYYNSNYAQRQLTMFSGLAVGVMVIAYVLQRVYIPERIWTYQIVFIACLFALLLNSAVNRLPAKLRNNALILIAGMVVVMNVYLSNRNDFVNWSLPRDNNSRHIAHIFLQNNVQRYYLNFDYYKPMLEYYYKTRNKNLQAVMGNPGSVDYAPFNPAGKLYDAIIWDNCAEPLPTAMQATCHTVFTDEEITVWLCNR